MHTISNPSFFFGMTEAHIHVCTSTHARPRLASRAFAGYALQGRPVHSSSLPAWMHKHWRACLPPGHLVAASRVQQQLCPSMQMPDMGWQRRVRGRGTACCPPLLPKPLLLHPHVLAGRHRVALGGARQGSSTMSMRAAQPPTQVMLPVQMGLWPAAVPMMGAVVQAQSQTCCPWTASSSCVW